MITRIRAPRIYATAMKGTTLSAKAAMLLRPPRIMTPATIMRTMPMISGTNLPERNDTVGASAPPMILVPATAVSGMNADSRFKVILFIWPMLPIPNDARAAKQEKRMARIFPITLHPL